MAGDHAAAVRHGIQVAFGPVPGGVHAHGEPEAAGATQGEAEKQTDESGAERACPCLAGVAQVYGSKNEREHQRRRPEPHPSSEGELGVATESELLEETHQKEVGSPEGC